ncbi:MAG: type III-B CRISPR module RAMP protein Cmr6 [Gammaproteobacteria bacterium]|nr:type III-B CRISPR module RAMP protein Cmr6 [Gammaproteobacteria bacterium]MBU1655809.1 type III-B CRISPR module RAMP protein Cmr6 [Gammaproteobacteria bacterium]MBU1960200.1 type III-B CRISPR module RAMP protein Cmr6 [Gammaproteobacteria bacterium]
MTPLMRRALEPLYRDAGNAHPGLLIQRGLPRHDKDNPKEKNDHIARICQIGHDHFYQHAYERWQRHTQDRMRFAQLAMKVETRLFIGLTAGGMLETGCAIHHSYGMPFIPGSSIKGVVSHHVRGTPFCQKRPEARALLFGADADPDSDHPEGRSGILIFHDAWWKPGSAETPSAQEVVTTHHPAYYGESGAKPATDFDSPVPNGQIAVRGSFLFTLEGPPGWIDLGRDMLQEALTRQGIGAKTRGGYGFMVEETHTEPAVALPPWLAENLQKIRSANREPNLDNVWRGKGLAQSWQQIEDPALKTAVLAAIKAHWQRRDWWDAPQGNAAKKAKAIYQDTEQ